jgi:sec-independent protein translocase protein TatC
MSDNKIVKAIKDKGKGIESEMSFFGHLEALRWHLVRSVIAVVLFAVVAFWKFTLIYNAVIMGPWHPDTFWTFRVLCELGAYFNTNSFCVTKINATLISTGVGDQFLLQLNSSIMMGIICGIPYILWELWRFIKPALLEKERKAASGFVFYATVLFIAGILFGYYILAPESIAFLASYSVSPDIHNTFTVGSYLSILSTVTVITGVVFELPIFIYILASLGILTATFMRKTRRYAIVIIMIVGAIISPSPDVLTTTIATVPLFILYEVGIVVASVVEKRRNKSHDELMAS